MPHSSKALNADWQSHHAALLNHLKQVLYPASVFRASLAKLLDHPSSPLRGLEICVNQFDREMFNSGRIGICDGIHTNQNTDGFADDSSLKITYWEKPGEGIKSSEVLKCIGDLVEQFWHADARTKGFGVCDAQYDSIKAILAGTLDHYARAHPQHAIYIVYVDLDGFKAINDKISHDTGNSALKDVAQSIESVGRSKNLLGFRNGGDEFVLAFFGQTEFEVLDTLYMLREAVRDKSYGPGLKIDFSAGVASVDLSFLDAKSFDNTLARAESATKGNGEGELKGEKRRGKVSFDSVGELNNPTASTTYAEFAIALARTKQDCSDPFSNIPLNFVSYIAAKNSTLSLVDPAHPVNVAIAWLGIEVVSESYSSLMIGPKNSGIRVSRIALAAAIVKGLLYRAASNAQWDVAYSISISADAGFVEIKDAGGITQWSHGSLCHDCSTYQVGVPINAFGRLRNYPPCLGLEIGFDSRPLAVTGDRVPAVFFSEIVVVDERPRTGGGLPDFWQAAIAHVISGLGSAPSADHILVFGNSENAESTVKRLRGEIQWAEEEMMALTALDRGDFSNAKSVLAHENISYIETFEEAIHIIYERSLLLKEWKTAATQKAISPKIQRSLRHDDFWLNQTDGIKCNSISEAYPFILEILRNAGSELTTFDDASQEMRELIGFKALIQSPNQDFIPEYWIEQREEFMRYAENVLLREDSLIGQHWHKDGQLQVFIKHLSDYCVAQDAKKSTRRAILIVKNIIADDVPKPLGLVSLWATPRFSDGRYQIDFCLVWRTVEALVGFPYSAFGSVHLANHLVEEVKKSVGQCVDSGEKKKIILGNLSYIALSLHMRVDEFHRRIAKRIVDDASY